MWRSEDNFRELVLFHQVPTLKPMGHQSTWLLFLFLRATMVAFTSLGSTFPQCRRQLDLYLAVLGVIDYHLIGSPKAAVVDLCYQSSHRSLCRDNWSMGAAKGK